MIFVDFIALVFGAFCLLFSAHDHVSRRGKGDALDILIDCIFAVGGLATFVLAFRDALV